MSKRREYGLTADVWTIGCITYNLFIGTPPFFDSDKHVMARKIKKGDWQSQTKEIFDKEATFNLKLFLNKTIVVDPEKRLNATDCVNHPLFRHFRDEEYK